MTELDKLQSTNTTDFILLVRSVKNLKFYIEFEPCKECKAIITEMSENTDESQTDEGSKKFLRHITYNHSEIVQAIVKDFPKEARKEEFPWFK